ncbi:hypothetical protein [Psychrobacter sp. Ps3]|uniref:hypothetical protein n=1 Tax=Psychrobacter sp. Ps3 TaxID=2790957 RepID=UPI001EDEE94A|nr:hypothetical protein [Psychrobacter sp. Ps3]MCG3882909.1 hypothetical protein [Psychrobacter sp. Ps3]
MQTKDPALTKTPISSHDAISEIVENTNGNKDPKYSEREQRHIDETVSASDRVDGVATVRDDANVPREGSVENHEDIERNTTVNKGTDTFEDDIVDSEHVNDGDNPARQPDRRDQQGSSPFDGNVNDRTVKSAEPKSEEINDLNRYASIDNAQTRILNPDEKD